jgi:hypothetical protein
MIKAAAIPPVIPPMLAPDSPEESSLELLEIAPLEVEPVPGTIAPEVSVLEDEAALEETNGVGRGRASDAAVPLPCEGPAGDAGATDSWTGLLVNGPPLNDPPPAGAPSGDWLLLLLPPLLPPLFEFELAPELEPELPPA